MQNDEDNADTCVLCFKEPYIFSVGECDHPVCYECSTRMRVLCQKTECPICRQDMPKVVFTTERKPFKMLQHTSQDRKYKIAFATSEEESAFRLLLKHNCLVCRGQPEFRTLELLKTHMMKEHNLRYCDLCVEHLKIFTFERRFYTREELGLHRRKGDKDDTSHRGHPICKYCDVRFVDIDELFRHLRRSHMFCHFCDADGHHCFFRGYDDLREHFRSDHYLCEEGECKDEKFTSVFNSDIDLKAHRASAHGKTLGKAAAKQARTLELEFTLAPRGRGNSSQNSRRGQNYSDDAEGAVGFMAPAEVQPARPARPNLLEENFPSLSGSSSAAPATSGKIMFKGGPKRLNMTEENFPSLSGEVPNVNISLQRGPATNHNSNNFSIKVQHKRRQEAAPLASSGPPQRGLVDFPSLGAPSKPAPVASSWKGKVVPKGHVLGKVVPQNQQRQQQPEPSLVTNSRFAVLSEGTSKVTVKPPSVVAPPEAEESKSSKSKKKKNKGRQNSSSPLPQPSSSASMPSSSSSSTSTGAKSKKKEERKCSELKIGALQGDPPTPTTPPVSVPLGPPPGFAQTRVQSAATPIGPPPGFSVTLNSFARPTNGLTSFTNSSGVSFPIPQTAVTYIHPTNSVQRNKVLVEKINARRSQEDLKNFIALSAKFQTGEITAAEYYNCIKETLDKRSFDELFPEILVLLPDIRRQQELWLAHGQKGNFSECNTCGQIVGTADLKAHNESHILNNNFPSLTLEDSAPKTPKWKPTK